MDGTLGPRLNGAPVGRRTVEPSPILVDPRTLPRKSWEVPLEFVRPRLSAAIAEVLRVRREGGVDPYPTVTVFCRGDRFFGLIGFPGPARPALLAPLDAWAMENRNDD